MDRDPFLSSPGIPVLNSSGEDIPPYGVMRLSAAGEDGVRVVGAPSVDDDPHVYVNGSGTLNNGVRGFVRFVPLGPVAYDPADGEPALNEEWGPAAGGFLLRKGNLGFRCAGGADGFTAVFARIPNFFEEEYDTYGYGSYDDGDGGTTWSHDAIINIGCDTSEGSPTLGDIVYDKVRYTVTLIMRNRRPFSSISMEVLEENAVAVATECKEIIDHSTITLTCVDGVPTLDFDTFKMRGIVCVTCP